MTHLHTTGQQLTEYAQLARAQAERLAAVADRLEATTDLGERMEEFSWVRHDTQRITDLLYLLAVGDTGASAVAAADPESRSKQAHYQRRQEALQRLTDDGVL